MWLQIEKESRKEIDAKCSLGIDSAILAFEALWKGYRLESSMHFAMGAQAIGIDFPLVWTLRRRARTLTVEQAINEVSLKVRSDQLMCRAVSRIAGIDGIVAL